MADERRAAPVQIVPEARRNAQLAIGQIHGVLHRVAIIDAELWTPLNSNAIEGELSRDDITAAFVEVTLDIGRVHAALNTGKYDEALAAVGFAGAQGNAKSKGWGRALREFAASSLKATGKYLSRVKTTLGWAGIIAGSLSTALKQEIDSIPGAGAAAEAVREFIELLQNSAESLSATQDSDAAPTDEASSMKTRDRRQS